MSLCLSGLRLPENMEGNDVENDLGNTVTFVSRKRRIVFAGPGARESDRDF